MTKTKATLVFKGILGNVVTRHVWLVEHGRGKYAQYNSAVFVKYIDKGARKMKGFWQSFQPYLVILDGWQDIQSQAMFNAPRVVDNHGTTVSEGKYMSFDPRWSQDFEAANEFKNIIADYRGVNTHEVLAA